MGGIRKKFIPPSHVYILNRRGSGVTGVRVFFMIPVDWERRVLFCFQLSCLSQTFNITVIAF